MHHKLDIQKELLTAWEIAKLNKTNMHHVAQDHSKTTMGYYIIIAAALLSALGQQTALSVFKVTPIYSVLMAAIQVAMARPPPDASPAIAMPLGSIPWPSSH